MVSKLRTHKRFSFNVRRNAPRPHYLREARGTLNPEERDLLLEMPVVVAQAAHRLAEGAEAFADTLANRLKPGATLGRRDDSAQWSPTVVMSVPHIDVGGRRGDRSIMAFGRVHDGRAPASRILSTPTLSGTLRGEASSTRRDQHLAWAIPGISTSCL